MFSLAIAGVAPLVLPDLSGLAIVGLVAAVAIVVSLVLLGLAGAVRR